MFVPLCCVWLVLLWTNFSSEGETPERIIYVDGRNGANLPICLTNLDSSIPCHDLDWVFQNLPDLNFTTLVLSEDTHYLSKAREPIQNTIAVSFKGNKSTIFCGDSVGLAFVNVVNISFYDISFSNCGSLRNSTSKKFDKFDTEYTDRFKAALYFENCMNIVMESVTVSACLNSTGMAIYDGLGFNTFQNCNFTDNIMEDCEEQWVGGAEEENDEKDIGGGGGGVYIELTFCKPGKICSNKKVNRSSAHYEFVQCTFHNNIARTCRRGGFIYPYKSNHQSFSRGGGLSFSLKGNNSNTSILVDSCDFSDNIALWGGGLYVGLYDNVSATTVTITNCNFSNNSALIQNKGGGGGLRLAHYISETVFSNPVNFFLVQNCKFEGNLAVNGGGLSLTWLRQTTHAIFKIANSWFWNNKARLGSAIYIYQFWKSIYYNGVDPTIEIENCEIVGNSDMYRSPAAIQTEAYELGIGAVYISSTRVEFVNSVKFIGNTASALAISDGSIVVRGSIVTFTGNEGSVGAAIALFGTSSIDFGSRTKMTFEDNIALMQGGAIYAEFASRQTKISDPNCFVRYIEPVPDFNEWNITMTFINNRDHNGDSNNSIHATSILPCEDLSSQDSSAFCWNGWSYFDSYTDNQLSDCGAHISSDLGDIVLTKESVTATPGGKFELPIYISDDLNGVINNDDLYFYLDVKNDTTVYNSITLCRNEGTVEAEPLTQLHATLTAAGGRTWSIDFLINLTRCPPGFIFNNYSRCVCYNGYKLSHVKCDEKTGKAEIAKNIWMGKMDHLPYYSVIDCPYHYCQVRTKPFTLLNDSSDLDTTMCRNYRRGIICGECMEGYGPAVNSPDYPCVNCTDVDLKVRIPQYIATVYVPLAILFIAIILFDIHLTSGPANAFILYSQVVATTFSLDADGGIPLNSILFFSGNTGDILMLIYKIPYNIFNLSFEILNFKFPICFSSKMDTLLALCFEYGVALFPLIMIGIIVITLKLKERCSNCCAITSEGKLMKFLNDRSRKIRSSLLPAFATFILLSYTKFSSVSSQLMNVVQLKGDNYSRLYLAGQYDETKTNYKIYLTIGCVMFAMFAATTPILLLDYPIRFIELLISKFSLLSRMYPIIKIHILLDTFQGCYKKNTRFFAGLYFLCRLIITLAYVFCSTWVERFMIQQVTITIMIALLAFFMPYRVELNFVNYVDIFIFSNLAVLNSLTLYLHVTFKVDPEHDSNFSYVIFITQYVVVFFPLVYMVSYVLWMLYKKIKANSNYDRLPSTANNEEDIFERARHPNIYQQPPKPVERSHPSNQLNVIDTAAHPPDTSHSNDSSTLLAHDASIAHCSYQALQQSITSKTSEGKSKVGGVSSHSEVAESNKSN